MNNDERRMRSKAVVTGLSTEKPESALPTPLDNNLSGALARGRRALVCFTRRTTKLGDDDNMAESYKWLRDWLRYAGLIIGDGPGEIEAKYRQEKVTRRKEMGTIITVTYLED